MTDPVPATSAPAYLSDRARGMRAVHERPEGFSVRVSKTYAVDVGRLFRAFVDTRQRNRWLERGTLNVRTAQEGRSARFDFRDGPTRVSATFTARGSTKASVSLQHKRLQTAEEVEEIRAFGTARATRARAGRLKRSQRQDEGGGGHIGPPPHAPPTPRR